MAKHATLSPSSADRWVPCPGSVALSKGLPDTAGSDALAGTLGHGIHENALALGITAEEFVGSPWPEDFTALVRQADEKGIEIDDDMIDAVQASVDRVMSIWNANKHHPGAQLIIEAPVPISQITGEEGAEGTSDVIITAGDTMWVLDLKMGRGVQVFAEDNRQMMMYAGGALELYDLMGEIEKIVMGIHQPRLGHFDYHELSRSELDEKLAAISDAAKITYLPNAPLNPGEKQCRFCRAAATCPAANKLAQDTIAAQFDELPDPQIVPMQADQAKLDMTEYTALLDGDALGLAMSRLDFIDHFAKTVRAEVERRLLRGEQVPGYKLVEGRQGNRTWADAKVAEEELKKMRLRQDEMYTFKLVSPTVAEKLAKKGEVGPRQWAKLQSLIVRNPGKPSVAPVQDKRAAITAQPVAFDEVEDDEPLA